MFESEVINLLQEIYEHVEEINDADRDPEDVMSYIQKQINQLQDYHDE